MKTEILAAIGETVLQPAASINAALAANDRIKYCLSLLQMAAAYAEDPKQPAVTLKQERLACGIDQPDLDTVVSTARMAGKSCHVAGAANILTRMKEDMQLMAAPVLATKPDGLGERLGRLLASLPPAVGDLLDTVVLSTMMRAGHEGPDSLHHLVMELHKRLNAMQADLAEEILDGAAVYNLADADRALVSAFMAGLSRTAKLKFNHPGLATTATRSGNRLIIQNDLGTTDAHVIVIHVTQSGVSVTYTDVHPERLTFFKEMLKPQAVIWDKGNTSVLASGAAFYMATGHLDTKTTKSCGDYLDFLASRLVFLIDWNHARKQLRDFLRGPDRLALLSWAAENETGHRSFLELGGARLINQAIEATAGSSLHFGDRLCDLLGDAEALKFLRFVFQTTTDGLLSKESPSLIRDHIRVTLATHFSNEEQQLLRLAIEHAGLVFELANSVRDRLRGEPDGTGKLARRARRFEHDADHLLIETREAVRRRQDYAVFLPMLEAADEAADQLEDAAFLLQLKRLEGKPLEALQTLADLLVEASQEWIKALGHASQIGSAASPLESDDFLTAIDRLAALEHDADDAQRILASAAVDGARDFKQLYLFTGIGDRLEAAADALKHASLILRDHILADVIDG